ncbi:alpha-ketoacid dehydrogenase subunit beta [Streptomyces kunmingensis]|uniref:3-methyl-2-oxobutanoate dehydrogenase (2-methylpropanoyl-transferring) n=1 Tax=Streptomyces kunmingensis TaxID=68225 RepID=A0ABU6C9K2_9ACTN|nr:alpha-ketoacid dehydrogenase subunit beta [Streptomyces kunmingensis]MEB3960736.1 alpha-ketoacid dehydrogenase subunit beta [Streptomyces kunmingensis]
MTTAHTGGGAHEKLTMVAALNTALADAMAEDTDVLLQGEDIGVLGGVFRVTDGLQKRFGADRVIDSPLAESGLVGTAIGMALGGLRPVVEIQFDGFVFPAFNQIVTQLAKMHARSQGMVRLPVVIRMPYGGGIGGIEHHSESPEAYFMHTAGLRVVSPSQPEDAYWMLRQAIRSDDPVIFLEPKRRYWEGAEVDLSEPPAPLHSARVVRPGDDLTLVGYGPSVKLCLEVADAAATEGRSVEVVDLRSLSPLDIDTVERSVRRTGHLVVVHEAPTFVGPGAEIVAKVQERCFYHLESPVLRVGGFHAPYPPARIEDDYLPGLDRVLHVMEQSLAH